MTRLGAVLVLVLAASSVHAQQASNDVALIAGHTSKATIDMKARGVDLLEIGGSFTWALEGRHWFGDHLGAGLAWSQQQTGLRLGTPDAQADLFNMTVSRLHGTVAYRLGGKDARLRPFAEAAVGGAFFSADDLDDEAKLSWSLGAGVDWTASDRLGLSLRGRWVPTQLGDTGSDRCDPFGFCQGSLSQVQVMGGVVLRF